MADQQTSYSVPPAPPTQRRRLFRILPWSLMGFVLAVPYLLMMLFVWGLDLSCQVDSGEWCGFMTFIFTAPASMLIALLMDVFGVPGLLDKFVWVLIIPVLLNTLLIYLIGAGLGWIGTKLFRGRGA